MVIPTLTPTPAKVTKIVLLPGLGGSWNNDAILNCKSDNYEGDWTISPFAKEVYEPLINNFKRIGLDVLTFYYDWRKTVSDNSVKLEEFISSRVKKDEKVYLVGHSMGGLVALTYGEKDRGKFIEKLMTLGSPYRGVASSYSAWAGGDLWSGDSMFFKIAQNIGVKRCSGNGNNKLTLQKYFPSIQQLLPSYDYLRNLLTSSVAPVHEMINQNNLFPLETEPSTYGFKLGTLAGTNFETLNMMTVRPRNKAEVKKDIWADGKPVSFEKTKNGDGTVTQYSVFLQGADNRIISKDHSGIVASGEGINNILNFLVPSGVYNFVNEYKEPASELIFLSEAGSLSLRKESGEVVSDENGIINIPNPKDGGYEMKLNVKSKQLKVVVAQFKKSGVVSYKDYVFLGKGIKIKQFRLQEAILDENLLSN